MTEIQVIPIRNKLEKLLQTLKKNKDNVPINELKTTYKKGYEALCADISNISSEYAKAVVLQDLRFHIDFADEAASLINNSIDESGTLKKLSTSIFMDCNLATFDFLLAQLREKVITDLEPFYTSHVGLFFSSACLTDQTIAPKLYCLVNGCIRMDDQWVPIEKFMYR